MCVACCAYFGHLVNSTFIFNKLEFSPSSIDLFYITIALSYVPGNVLNKRIVKTSTIDNVKGIPTVIVKLFNERNIMKGQTSKQKKICFRLKNQMIGCDLVIRGRNLVPNTCYRSIFMAKLKKMQMAK